MFTPRTVTSARSAEKVSTFDQIAPLAVERVTGHGADLAGSEVVDAAADLLVAGETEP